MPDAKPTNKYDDDFDYPMSDAPVTLRGTSPENPVPHRIPELEAKLFEQ